MDKQDIARIKDEILLAMLPNVAFDGWNWDALCVAAQDCGYGEDTVRAVFPEKMIGVLDHFSDWADREMLSALADINPDDLRVRDRVREAVMKRFEVLNPHKEALRQSIQYLAWPTRKPRAVKFVWRTADCIWQWAGDKATDYNRYTKRGLLSGVLVSTTLAWLGDYDEDMSVTRSFLDHRINNVMQFGKITGRFKAKFA